MEYAVLTHGIEMLPLRTPTLPPATHTNCYLVGQRRFVVIDPGSPAPQEQRRLDEVLAERLDAGDELAAVLLTHHHPDHVLGVVHLVQSLRCEVWAHETTAQLVDFAVDRTIEDGEALELGADTLRALFTPGHAPGHLAFLHERTHALLCGDLIASTGTILVNPPEGHMGDYLASLQRAKDVEASALYPAHGGPIDDAEEVLQRYIDHRHAREAKILNVLAQHGDATAFDLVPQAYDDAPPSVWPYATRSALAHLIHLVELGAATRDGDLFRAT